MSKHPEFDLESQRLARCIQMIETKIRGWKEQVPSGGDEWADQSLLAYQGQRAHELGATLSQPYFGRLDFREAGQDEIGQFYIGKVGLQFDDLRVIDWRAPFASLFYLKKRYHGSFKAPGGAVSGDIFLKRHLEIELGQLRNILDEIDRRSQVAKPETLAAENEWIIDPDDYLRIVLEGRRGEGLREIVATIQEQQNELIRAEPELILIIQGAAGSGKTTVALHRIAYLLYPQEGTPAFRPERMLILGSNAVFLSFLKEVLPSLGIQNIAQTTFVDWALSRMQLPNGTAVSDRTLEVILDRGILREKRTEQYRRSLLKGSLHMRDLIEACAQDYRHSVHIPEEGLTYCPRDEGSLDLVYHVPIDFLRKTYAQCREVPVNEQRRRLIDAVVAYVMDDHTQRFRDGGRALVERLSQENGTPDELKRWSELVVTYRRNQKAAFQKLRAEVRMLVETDMERYWPTFTPLLLYDRLLTDRQLLKRVVPKQWHRNDRDQLYQPGGVSNDLRIEDLASLLYLHILLEGSQSLVQLYDHIVVDEAQDLAPFQIWLLRHFLGKGSMTILGDLAQSIHSYRGISSWDRVREAFPGDKVQYAEMARSYRATHEIMSFANQIIDSLNEKSKLGYRYSEPFPRHGPPVRYEIASSTETWIECIAGQIEAMSNQTYQRVAVICKSIEECAALHTALSRQGLSINLLSDPEQELGEGVILLPVHLTKGLEFEACIVANANSEQFTETELDGRLLYVAVTRALHELAVFCLGEPSTHLSQVAS